eukprot:scaffold23479_cov143-Cylindrotheca_fusiformis.AAC.7
MLTFRLTVASILLLQASAFQTQQPWISRSFAMGMSTTSQEDLDTQIEEAKTILYAAAETKAEDSDKVVGALLDLEKLMRKKNKENESQMQETLEALSGNGGGSWRLIFTTGTVNTQERTGRINYFPIKATQSFNMGADPWYIENGLYAGDFPLVKFRGDFTWMASQKSGVTKLEFDFTSLKVLNFFDIKLGAGQAANLGAKSGLGSEGNVDLEKKGRRAFFNWISADDKIATARGGGGGLALWKRVDYEGEK